MELEFQFVSEDGCHCLHRPCHFLREFVQALFSMFITFAPILVRKQTLEVSSAPHIVLNSEYDYLLDSQVQSVLQIHIYPHRQYQRLAASLYTVKPFYILHDPSYQKLLHVQKIFRVMHVMAQNFFSQSRSTLSKSLYNRHQHIITFFIMMIWLMFLTTSCALLLE